jgi:hypothetical protein
MPKIPKLSPAEADAAYAAAQKVVDVHRALAEHLEPGQTTAQIDAFVGRTLESLKCKSCFYGYKPGGMPPFPSHACLSVNDCIVHGTAGSYEPALRPGDVLKIDMEFVRDMLIDPNDLEIVEIVIRLSHTFGRTVVAEGVETLQHAALLAWLGCHQAQGYGIARPLAADQVLGWISRWSAHREWEELDPDEQTARRYPEMELLGAVQNHRHWMYRVEQALAGASPDELRQIAEGDCPFGRWYDGPGRERFGHLAEFLAVGERHAELHRVVADCSSRGSVEGGSASTATLRRRVEDASRMLRGELKRLVQRIQADAPGAQDAPR